jgi:hypothetical protein
MRSLIFVGGGVVLSGSVAALLVQGSPSIQPLVAQVDVIMESWSPPLPNQYLVRFVASDERGSAIAERTPDDLEQGFHTRRLHLASGDMIDVADTLGMKTTWPGEVRGYGKDRARQMAANCAGTLGSFRGMEQIRTAWVEVHNSTMDATRWLHVDSGCTEVQAVISWKDPAGKVTGRTTYTLHHFQTDPASLDHYFAISGSYREAAPDEVRRARMVEKLGGEEKA